MKIKSLYCKGFLPFTHENYIEFDDEDLIGIIGKWDSDPLRSNRSGKSSFIEAILYALYGKTRVNVNKAINDNSDEMLVELTLEQNGKELTISRGRDISGSPTFDVTGFEGENKNELQKKLDKILGIDYKTFITVYYFLQGEMHGFMEAKSTEMKEYVSKWIEKTYWKDLEAEAKDILKDYEDSIKIKEADLEITGEQIETFEDEIEEIDTDELNKKLKEKDEEKKDAQEKINKLNKELSKLEKLKELKENKENAEEYLKEIKIILEEYNEQIIDLETELDEAIEREEKIAELKEKVKEINKKDYDKLLEQETNDLSATREEIAVVKNNIKNKQSTIERIKDSEGICPLTGLECENGDVDKTLKKEIENVELLEINLGHLLDVEELTKDRITYIKEQIKIRDKTNKRIAALEAKDSSRKIKEKIKKIKQEIIKHEDRLIRHSKKLENIRAKMNEYSEIDFKKVKEKIEELNEKIEEIEVDILEINLELNTVEEKKKTLKKLKTKYNKLEKQIEELKILYSDWQFIVYMFSKNGIPSHQIETGIKEVEQEANYVLEKLDTDMQIEFSSYRELNKWEDSCIVCGYTFPKGYRKKYCEECGSDRQKKVKDELSLKVFIGDKERDFQSESGGGKVLISFAIRLALIRMLKRRTNVQLSFVVLDEVFGMLDVVNRSTMMKLIIDFIKNDLGIKQILVISHVPDVIEQISNLIQVTKYKDYSSFSWVS